MAEPIVVDRKLREIFDQRQDEIQTDRRKEIDGLRKGLTAENFKKRAGAAYREITYALKGASEQRERMTMPKKLREILEKDLKQAGSISRLTIDGTAFRIYLLNSKDEASMKVGLLEVRKLTYDGWVAERARNYR